MPFSILNGPYLSVPQLTGYLRKRNQVEVIVKDLNIEAIHWLLKKEQIAKYADVLRARMEDYNNYGPATDEELRRYSFTASGYLWAEALADQIEERLSVLHNSRYSNDSKEVEKAQKILGGAFRILSGMFYPTKITYHQLDYRYLPLHLKFIKSILSMRKEWMFDQYFKDHAIPWIKKRNPKLIGISATFPGQIIPAFLFCSMLKSYMPEIPVVIGGAVLTYINAAGGFSKEVFDYVDGIIVGKGEIPLERYLDHIRGSLSLKDIPGLVYRDGKHVKSPAAMGDKVSFDPTIPDFSDMPFHLYFLPFPIIPIMLSEGCYWQKCSYCSRRIYNKDFIQGEDEKAVIEHIKKCISISGSNEFQFVDDALLPGIAVNLSKLIIKNELGIRWLSLLRFEPHLNKDVIKLFAESGCRKVFFGLESANPDILKKMRKQIDLNVVRTIIQNAHREKIKVGIFLITGFPGETKEQALESWEFVYSIKDYLSQINFYHFILEIGSAIYENPELFNITEVRFAVQGTRLLPFLFYSTSHGMTQEESYVLTEELISRTIKYFLDPRLKKEKSAGPGIQINDLKNEKIRKSSHLKSVLLCHDYMKIKRKVDQMNMDRIKKMFRRKRYIPWDDQESKPVKTDNYRKKAIMSLDLETGTIHELQSSDAIMLLLCDTPQKGSQLLSEFTDKVPGYSKEGAEKLLIRFLEKRWIKPI